MKKYKDGVYHKGNKMHFNSAFDRTNIAITPVGIELYSYVTYPRDYGFYVSEKIDGVTARSMISKVGVEVYNMNMPQWLNKMAIVMEVKTFEITLVGKHDDMWLIYKKKY